MLKQNFLFNVVEHYISDENTETIVVEYSNENIIPRIRGQWKKLKNGHIQVAYTREQFEYCQKLVNDLLED